MNHIDILNNVRASCIIYIYLELSVVMMSKYNPCHDIPNNICESYFLHHNDTQNIHL